MFLLLATLLITVITANIFIQQASGLEKDVYKNLKKAENNAGNGIVVLDVIGEDGTTGVLRNFTMTFRAVPRADTVNFDHILFAIQRENGTLILKYGGESATNMDDANSTHYAIEYVSSSEINHINGYLKSGESAKIHFMTGFDINTDTILVTKFIPRTGTPTTKSVYIPEVINSKIVQIYPQV